MEDSATCEPAGTAAASPTTGSTTQSDDVVEVNAAVAESSSLEPVATIITPAASEPASEPALTATDNAAGGDLPISSENTALPVTTQKPVAAGKTAKKLPVENGTGNKPKAAPRKKPTTTIMNPSASAAARSRAKPMNTPPAPAPAMISFISNDQVKFINNTFNVVQQATTAGNLQQLPPQQRGARVLLPKPLPGQINTPLRPAVSGQSGQVQLQNGAVIQFPEQQQQQQQQFVSFQNGHFQQSSDQSSTRSTMSQSASGQPQMLVMNNQNSAAQTLMQVSAAPQSSPGQFIQFGGNGQPAGNMVYMATQPNNQMISLGCQQIVSSSQPQQGSQQPQLVTPAPAQPGTVQVRLQVIQTANGPMTLAFFPDQNNSFTNSSVGMQQMRLQSTTDANASGSFNFISQQQPSRNFVNAQTQKQTESAYQKKKSDEAAEAEFNLEEFLMPGIFTTPSAASEDVSLQSSQDIMSELVSGPMFQSSVPVKSVINGPSGQKFPPSLEDGKKRRKRPTKKEQSSLNQVQTVEFKFVSENKNLKKVEEILKSYAEEKSRSAATSDCLPTAPFLLSVPPSLSSTSVVTTLPKSTPTKKIAASKKAVPPSKNTTPLVYVACPTTPSVPSPLSKPSRPKTDLALRYEKDEQSLEKLSGKAFKGSASAINRVLPFHLLATPDESPDMLHRDSVVFHHVAQTLLERERALYSRFMQQIVSDASEPLSKLDILACSSTWLEMEREEFAAEKIAAAQGGETMMIMDSCYSNLEPDIPYHNGDYLLGFTEPVTDIPGHPPPPFSSSQLDEVTHRLPPSTVTVVVPPEAGKLLKLRVKRSLPVEPPTTASTPEPSLKKISLKFRMSAKEGWVVGRTANAAVNNMAVMESMDSALSHPQPEGVAVEDVITRSAVDSILHVKERSSGVDKKGFLPSSLLPVTNGMMASSDMMLDEPYFYERSSQFLLHQHEPMETDTALDEAINSILG